MQKKTILLHPLHPEVKQIPPKAPCKSSYGFLIIMFERILNIVNLVNVLKCFKNMQQHVDYFIIEYLWHLYTFECVLFAVNELSNS